MERLRETPAATTETTSTRARRVGTCKGKIKINENFLCQAEDVTTPRTPGGESGTAVTKPAAKAMKKRESKQ